MPQKCTSLSLLVSSHPLDDVGSLMEFEGDDSEGSSSSMQQQLAAAAKLAAPAPRPRQKLSDVSVPAPQRPLVWKTRLADRATAAVTLEARYSLSPHTLFELLADPTQHATVFDEILAADAELLEEAGPRRKWRLDYTARWQFWRVAGVCENKLFMWTDSEAGTVTFKLREPGFLKRYEGTWQIMAGCGSPLSAFSANASSSSSSAASSTYNLSSSGSGSSRGSSPASSPRASWAAGLPTAEMFGARLSRGGSGGSSSAAASSSSVDRSGSSSSLSMRALPLATVSPLATTAGLPVGLGQSVSGAAATLGSSLMDAGGALWRWLGLSSSSSTAAPSAAHTPGGTSDPIPSWPPLFKSSGPARSASGSSSRGSWSLAAAGGGASLSPEQQQQRQLLPMPTTALITASTLTSPKLTPPYPLNSLLKTQSKGQVEEMLEGLVRAAAAQLQAQPLV